MKFISISLVLVCGLFSCAENSAGPVASTGTTDTGGGGGTSGTITITANPTTLTGSNKTSTITASLVDNSGNNVSDGTIVNFSVNPSTIGSISVTSTTTVSGQGSTIFTSTGTFGTATITADSGDLIGSVSITVTGTGAAASVVLTATPSSISVLGLSALSVAVKDSSGNNVPDGTNVDWSVDNTGLGSISVESSTTSGGVAIATFEALNSPGTVTVTASSGSVSTTATIEIIASEAGSIVFTSATPSNIGLRGTGITDFSKVVFSVFNVNGESVADGTNIDFCLFGPAGGRLPDAGGEFIEERDNTLESYTDGNSNGCYDSGETYTDGNSNGNYDSPLHASKPTKDGNVSVTLHSGLISGNVTLVATIAGTSPPVASAIPVVSIGGGVPNMAHFSVAVDKSSGFNLPGLAYFGRETEIAVYLADRFGNANVLEGTTVSYYTESGATDTSSTTIDDKGKTTVTFRTQLPYPADVVPLTSETTFRTAMMAKYSISSPGYPRDGWATVTAAVDGEETFYDENSNGQWDTGESYDDTLTEVFVDYNDNNSRNDGASDAFEPYVDDNPADGVYTGANSAYDGSKTLFRDIRLLITGSPIYIKVTPTTFNIADGGSQTFGLLVSDVNLNPISTDSRISISHSEVVYDTNGNTDTKLGGDTSYTFPNTFQDSTVKIGGVYPAVEHEFVLVDQGKYQATVQSGVTITIKVTWEGYDYYKYIEGVVN